MKKHTGVTFQVRVEDYKQGIKWYEILFNRKPDLIPHGDFAEWEILSGAWLQVAKGKPSKDNGPVRLGVKDIHSERGRLRNELGMDIEDINTREGVPAAWCSFMDPDGNRVGLFQEF